MNIFSKIDCPNNEIIKQFSYHDHFYLCKHTNFGFSHLIMLFGQFYFCIKLYNK